MLIDFRQLFPRWNINPKGVLHVGGNVGEEYPVYMELGIETQIWFEPNPKMYNQLIDTISGNRKAVAYCKCVGDENKNIILHESSNAGQSSSILDLGTHAIVHPDVTYIGDIEVNVVRLDTFLSREQFNDVDFLNVDVQGAELLVLKGIGEHLNNFKAIYLEVNKAELYIGCPLVEDLDNFLLNFGFERVETLWAGNTNWGDALWIKKVSSIMINDFFDKVFVINLDERKDRMEIADCFLKEQGIEYERFPAIKHENGVKGLLLTMRELFKLCIERDYQRGVLILEDDFEFLAPVENFLLEVLPQLPPQYLTFHLGLNLLTVPERVSTNILLIDQAYSTHAIVYSREAINSILPMLERNESLAYDIMLRDEIQTYKRSFCTYPMLCTQRPDFSNIENRWIDWKTLSTSSFNRMTKSLQNMANEIAYCIGTHKLNGFEITVDPTLHQVQHPELVGQVCDCRRFSYFEEMCGCAIKEWRVTWKENTNQ